MKISFVTNFCPHYRVKTFEMLAQYYDVDFFFYAAGDEWYWQKQHGVHKGDFHYKYLPGLKLGQTRITPTLPWYLLSGKYDAYIKCINGRFALPVTYLIARMRNRPFILWTGIWTRLNTPAHRLFFPITKFIYTHADAVVVYGEHVKRYLIGEGVASERIFVTTHAVDNSFYAAEVSESRKAALREKLSISPDQKVVLYLGRLEEIKGLMDLIRGFHLANQPDTILVIAGEGSMRPSLEEQARVLGIEDQIRFAGYTSQADSVEYYAIAYVFVLPSITTPQGKETWGLVVNEAFNQGLPVIATEAVGAAAGGLVRDGYNGFIVPERSPERLAAALTSILCQPTKRDEMSVHARQVIRSWNNETMVMGFRNAIQFATQNFSKATDKRRTA